MYGEYLKPPSGLHSVMPLWKNSHQGVLVQSASSNPEVSPPTHGYIKDLSHDNDECPVKVHGTQNPGFQAITGNYQVKCDTNSLYIQLQNGILSLCKSAIVSTRGRNRCTIISRVTGV